jgi:hypothetical protein
MNNTKLEHEQSRLLSDVIIFIAGLAAAFYFIYRALTLSITSDEAITWQNHVITDGLFPAQPDRMNANHHLLNSWLMKIMVSLFGDSVISLRMPNVLAGLVYMGFAAAFARRMRPILGIVFFIALTAHPYVLQFFSLARGYGLSFAALVGGLYFAYRFWTEERSTARLVWMNLCFLLAVLSNLNCSFFIFPFLGVHFLFLLLKEYDRNLWMRLGISAAGLAIMLTIVFLYGQYLKKCDALFFGEPFDFWSGSISSLIHGMLMGAEWTSNALAGVKMFIRIVLFVSIAVTIFQLVRHKRMSFPGMLTVSFLGCVAFIIAMFYLNDTLYPYQRTGLYLVPPFFIMWVLTLNEAVNKWVVPSYILGAVTVVLALSNIIINPSVSKTFEWSSQEEIELAAQDLALIDPNGEMLAGVHWHYNPSLNYYRQQLGGPEQGLGDNKLFDLTNEFVVIQTHNIDTFDLRIWEVYKTYGEDLRVFRRREHFLNPDYSATAINNYDEGAPAEKLNIHAGTADNSSDFFLRLKGPSAWSFPTFIFAGEAPDTSYLAVADVRFMYRLQEAESNSGFFIGSAKNPDMSYYHRFTPGGSEPDSSKWQAFQTSIIMERTFLQGDTLRLTFVNDGANIVDIDQLDFTARFFSKVTRR